MGLFLLTVAAIAVIMLVMAIGVWWRTPCLRGTCGALSVSAANALTCEACPRRTEPPLPGV